MKKVLLIDDEKDFTELASTLLRFHDLDVDTSNDPKTIDDILKSSYDLIVTDLMMPHLNGFDVIKKLREHANYKDVPIIVLSAKTLTDEERKFLFRNRVHFLMKPFEPQGLVDQVTQLLHTN